MPQGGFITNIPNILTVFRITLVPVFAYLIACDRVPAATVVFAVAGITDSVDGFIARTFDLKTELGAYLDPFADKLLMTTSYLLLTYKGFIPVWLCGAVISRDVFIFVGALILKAQGRTVKGKPAVAGKAATVLQVLTVIAALVFYERAPEPWFVTLAALTTALTVYTWAYYSIREYRLQYR